MTDIRHTYKSLSDVHKKAQKILRIKQPELVERLGTQLVGKKNAMGDLFESWFGKERDNANEPDLGIVELKATPFKQNKNKSYSSKERLVLTMIDFKSVVNETFMTSHLFHKNKNLEIAFYEAYKNGNEKIPVSQRFFEYVALYQMQHSPKDLKIIENDFRTIQKVIKEGKAEQLSESLTDILGACPKGRNSKDTTTQPFSDKRAMRRAFSLKRGYMDKILQEVISGGKGDELSEAIIQDDMELDHKSLDEVILDRLNQYKGWTQANLMRKFDIKTKNAKSKNSILIKSMLGISSKNGDLDRVDEIKNANIVPKTIQFDETGYNKESMSLPSFKFKDLVEQNWTNEDGEPEADLNQYLFESKFLFVVFEYNSKQATKQKDANNNIFRGAKFFSIPVDQLDGKIKHAWEDTKRKLLEGVKLVHNKRTDNNLVKLTDRQIIHVRPHTGKSSYVNDSSTNQLPTPAQWTNKPEEYSDDYMTTQSFWLNKYYVKDAVKDLLE